MSSLRARLGKPLRPNRIEVQDGDDVFVLSGYPSAKVALDSIGGDSAEKLAALWNMQFCPKDEEGVALDPIPQTFTSDSVGQVKTIAHYIQPDEGEQPYGLMEVAEIFVSDPMLFLKLYGAAAQCMAGNKILGNKAVTDHDLAEVAAGKSQGGDTPPTSPILLESA